jgi:hypothetical protein
MTRLTRVRTRTQPYPGGSLIGVANGVPINASNSGTMISETCSDSHGRPIVPSNLTITKVDFSRVIPVHGTYTSASATGTATNYIPSGIRGDSLGPPLVPGRPSVGVSMTDLLARTNPSRPDVVPFDLIQDLVDIPRQLKDVGRLIRTPKRKLLNAKELANQHLGFQFGWLPLFKDVRDLLDLQHRIHKRVAELHRLYSAGGLKRRIHLGSWVHEETSNRTVESSLVMNCLVRRTFYVESERWGTVRWKPTQLPSFNPSDAEIIRQAKLVASGLSVEGVMKGSWDLLPWTWLLSWFTNISSFAMQYSTTVPALPSSACVMTRTRNLSLYQPLSMSSGYTDTGGYATWETKERFTGSGSIEAHLPFLTAGRLSILGALFVQRFKR